jgi:hypothetical protein
VSLLRRLNATPSTTVLLAILLGSALVGVADASSTTSDVQLFARAGGVLLSHNSLHAFGDPNIQAGPLELALVGAARAVGRNQTGFAILLDVSCTAVVALVAWLLLDRRAGLLAVFAAGAFAVWLPGAPYLGHPAEPLIAALWLLAAREARRGRTTLAGAYVGLSACWEVWGVLGVTALLLAPRLRTCVRGAVLAGALPLLAFLPFVLDGDFHMFQLHWPIERGLPLLLIGSGHAFTWPMRLAEAVVVVLAGGGVARATRRSDLSIWLVPLATALARIACDPVDYGYYWATPLVLAILGATVLISRRHTLAATLSARLRPTAS